jgi:hypothetical protein
MRYLVRAGRPTEGRRHLVPYVVEFDQMRTLCGLRRAAE